MNDLLKAYKTSTSLKKKGHIKHFDIKFRSKKARSESIVIHSKHYKSRGVFYPEMFGPDPVRAAEVLPDKLNYDCRLQKTRLGEFYFCILLPLDIGSENKAPVSVFKKRRARRRSEEQPQVAVSEVEQRILALDPGVRTFFTGYSPSGEVVEWGVDDICRIRRICYSIDRLQSKMGVQDNTRSRRYRLRRAFHRSIRRVRNLVDEVHKKLTRWLVLHYDVVLLPSFDVSEMVPKAHRKIGSKTARAMLTWSHYRFKQRLLDKTKEFPSCRVIVCDEHFTTKTCGQCGVLNDVGASKAYSCTKCDAEFDRDVNAARNVYLRYFTLIDRSSSS